MFTSPIISSGLRIMVSFPAFFMSKMALLHVNFSFINRVLLVLPSIILIIANPKISSINRALTFTSFCSSGFNIISFSGYIGTDLFRNLNQQSLEFMTPSSSSSSKLNLHFHGFQTPMYRFQICYHVFPQ